jgi:hypothetical protein
MGSTKASAINGKFPKLLCPLHEHHFDLTGGIISKRIGQTIKCDNISYVKLIEKEPVQLIVLGGTPLIPVSFCDFSKL